MLKNTHRAWGKNKNLQHSFVCLQQTGLVSGPGLRRRPEPRRVSELLAVGRAGFAETRMQASPCPSPPAGAWLGRLAGTRATPLPPGMAARLAAPGWDGTAALGHGPSPPRNISERHQPCERSHAYLMHATGVMSAPLAKERGCLQPPPCKNAGTEVNVPQTSLKYGDN